MEGGGSGSIYSDVEEMEAIYILYRVSTDHGRGLSSSKIYTRV